MPSNFTLIGINALKLKSICLQLAPTNVSWGKLQMNPVLAVYSKPYPQPRIAMLTGEIRSQIHNIWNAFWTGGISNPLEAIEQITYLLFLRRLDDLHTLDENKANRAEYRDRSEDQPLALAPINQTPTIITPTKPHFIGNFRRVSRSRRCPNMAISNDNPKA